ncbi:GMC family oxidoreductase [Rhodopirellula sp. JC740]|uniref:GMC family oxidoreductase n=1 Tax=Rhodopirellula halodulae TaxID=2894198 RepID=A0ABS8NEU9_9BACT|nr:GMC family oxidoreductase [Rhodopirellula sp. JC740]MCC9641949.1 GMC family oxidoreductase [Rhodopirellula sp. JC740]
MEVERPEQFTNADVILGGGLCGLLLAVELATRLRQSDRKIIVVEATGGEVPRRDLERPFRWLRLLGSEADYNHPTQPCEALAGRQIMWPRGRGWGGSGRINSMIWFPPTETDIANLVDVLREHDGDVPSKLNSALEQAKSWIRPEPARWLSGSGRLFLDAMKDADQCQFAAYDRLNRGGRRWTAWQAVSELLQQNPQAGQGLSFVRADVHSLRIQDGQATDLVWADRSTSRLDDDCQVISCLGTIGSPTLLQRSGHQVTGLGENLHDHLIMPVIHGTDSDILTDDVTDARSLASWQHSGAGRIACNVAECGGLDPDQRWQLHVTPTDYLRFPNSQRRGAMTIGVNVTQPKSRGRIRWTADEMSIETGYWNDSKDRDQLLAGVHWVRELVSRSRLATVLGAETIPGAKRTSDAALIAAMQRYTQTLYHPAGTCALGDVVDSQFKVRGLNNVRMVDASLLPKPTVGNPTATLAMLTCYAANRIA